MHASERARLSIPDVTADAELEVNDERASILSAAANARSIAMLTGTHGVIAMPIDVPRLRLPAPHELVPEGTTVPESEDDETGKRLRAVTAARAAAGDAVGELRARIDLAAAKRDAGDDAGARVELEAVLEGSPHAAIAHAMLRSLLSGRENLDAQLAHVTELAELAPSPGVRADWIAERARLLEAKSGASAESVAAWAEALALSPEHAGALYGGETALDATGQWSELASALSRLAELPETPPEIAAWLQVERALLFDRRLADQAGARAALASALALVPGIGPVRDACLDHAVSQRDEARLAGLLESEAALEGDSARAARLELDAALAHLAAGRETVHIIAVLERAHARTPVTPLTARRVAFELARLHDVEGRHADALRVRKAALRSVTDAREELVALRAIATSAERAGEIDEAVNALERARIAHPDDGTLLADVDRLLVSEARHEQRAILWMRESARVDDAEKKARALMAAAASSKAAGRDVDAGRYLQAAWVTAPAAPGVYDALCERLAPHADREAVQARIALYEQAARATPEPDKKILFLEKIAWLWDDVAGDAARAACAYEDVLVIEPARLSAITGLASAALRAGDPRALARAQKAEADITADLGVRAELRLCAAETLSTFDADRALALAQELREDARVSARAAELVTRLHAGAGRWDLAAKTLHERAASAEGQAKVALVLAEADVLLGRLRAPERALEALEVVRASAGADPAVVAATLDALEALGDEERLRSELEKLAELAASVTDRAALLVRAAELDERKDGREEAALRAYERAREAMPDEPLVSDRIRRLGARMRLGDSALVPPLAAAVRLLDASGAAEDAEPLLASGARDVATLRMIERLARRARSAPQLANALALEADTLRGPMAVRALEGLASLVAWTLPPSEDSEPWERLVAMGSTDASVLGTLIHRARPAVRAGDVRIVELVTIATQRRLELASDDTERLALHLDLARLRRRAQALALAIVECKQALAIDGGSFGAASLLAELAADLGDRAAGILAARALAQLAVDKKAKASLLRDAADLAAASKDRASAASLLEQALDADPDAVDVAARLADLQGQLGAFRDLGRALQRALRSARTAEAIVPMASELAEVARNRLQDPMLAIEALERARDASPKHVPTLFVLAELYIGQRAWDRALAALADVVPATEERGEKLVALVGRASIYRRVLDQPSLAEHELRAALEIDPHDVRALRGLLELRVIGLEERAALLTRLVITEQSAQDRLAALLELAEARRALGDGAGAEGALVEAAALSPDPAMLARVRAAAGNDAEAAARVLSRAVARAREAGRALTPTWLVGLGELELELGRVDESIERFEEALQLDAARDDARFALARAYAARGRHDTAAAALTPLLDSPTARPQPLDAGFVRLLEASLSGAGRSQQAQVARELRAIGGDLDPASLADLDGRRSMHPAQADGLPASSLRSFVMPGGLGKHPIWDVAAVASSFAGKLARIGLAEQGVSSRDRIKPKAMHPVRQLFDRMTRAFEVIDVEIAVSEHAIVPAIACEDVPWIIVPASLGDWPEPYAVAALARPLTRIALGVPWLGPLGAHEVLSVLVAFARQVAPSFSATPADRVEALVDDYSLRARRAIDRRRRRVLEELEPVLERAAPIDEASFSDAVARTEARASFLLSGSLRASLEALGGADQELGAALRVPGPAALRTILSRPAPRDVVAFALSPDATALRRSLGTLSA